ncbi:MAG: 50S ribosomal protein L29 [Methylococcales bacterium]|nr:50S ribosomal protein L29 [Methylococcales bacterium]
MKASELRQKTGAELNEMLHSLSREQFNLRMQKGTQQLLKPDQIKKVRRDIARVHTIVKELAGA